MKKVLLIMILGLAAGISEAQTNNIAADIQIKNALLAAPADKRDGATVYGYNQNKELVILKKGTNEIICLADDPNQKGFSASAYHRDLEPFMARGRELKKQGKTTSEIFDTREKEAKAGKLSLPKQPTALFVYSAPEADYNTETGELKSGSLRYVVYTPYATAETTGLPLKPEVPGMPWIMHPGTHGAHIMITPPNPNKK